MRKLIELIGFLVFVQGVAGFAGYVLFDHGPIWFLPQHMGFYEGNEVFTNIALLVLGVAVMASGKAVGDEK